MPNQALPIQFDSVIESVVARKRNTLQARVVWGDHVVSIGGDAPVRIQSMTNTDTEDVELTVEQVVALHLAGSEMVRLTVNTPRAAQAVPHIRELLDKKKCYVPLIGDFHYNGHKLLSAYPQCAQALSKYRINPGNVGKGDKHDLQFSQMIEIALKYDKPIRIGVNWGSLDQELLARLTDENAKRSQPWDSQQLMYQAVVTSALDSAKLAKTLGMNPAQVLISCKMSQVCDLITVYQILAARCRNPLHLGLTEAGMGIQGAVASAAALAPLLLQGIGDTIRVSLTPQPGEARTQEVFVAQEILQALNLKRYAPSVTACPGCGRTSSSLFQDLAKKTDDYLKKMMPQWRVLYPGVENMKVAVMGCIVNGPGESQHANVGISLPGNGEAPLAPVFIDGERTISLKGDGIAEDFIGVLDAYVRQHYPSVR